eukprot:gene2417-8734_t
MDPGLMLPVLHCSPTTSPLIAVDHALTGPLRPSAACSEISLDSSAPCFLAFNDDSWSSLSVKAPSPSYLYQATASICSKPTSAASEANELPATPRATSTLNLSNSYFSASRNNNQFASPSAESRRESRRESHSLLSRPPLPSRPSAKRRLFSSDASDQAPAAVATIFHALPSLLRTASNGAAPTTLGAGLWSIKPIATTYTKQDGKTETAVSTLGLSGPAPTSCKAEPGQVSDNLLPATSQLVPASPIATKPCPVVEELAGKSTTPPDQPKIPGRSLLASEHLPQISRRLQVSTTMNEAREVVLAYRMLVILQATLARLLF